MYIYLDNGIDKTNLYTEVVDSKYMGSRMPKVKIRTVLQTTDDVNFNKRIYPRYLVEKAINSLQPLIQSRTLLGELDHPVLTGNTEVDEYRHFVVLYDNVSHIINKMWMDGNMVMGEIETTSTDNGYKLAGLIMDGVKVGFSVRAVGECKTRSDGITEITTPFEIITYDCVSNPSHEKARMIEIVKEHFTNSKKRASYLTESNILVDRFDIVNGMFNSKPLTENKIKNDLETLLKLLEINLKHNKLMEAENTVDKLIENYLYDEEEYKKEKNLIDFLDDYINNKEPMDVLFKKYFGIK